MSSIYFETQEEKTSTCFIHAMNNYFQKEYLNETFFNLFSEKLKNIEIDSKNTEQSFFNQMKPFESKENDLFDYFEIHSFTSKEMFLENILESKGEQLSPNEGKQKKEFKV
jgi:hypothetical protein